MKKRVFSILTALCLCLTLLPTAAFAADSVVTGSGTEETPYRISDADGLKWFRDKVNSGEYGACAVLTANINLNDEEWTPIGPDTGSAYTGTFDGKGYAIKNLSITGNFTRAGLFGCVKGGAIRNLTVAGSVACTVDYGWYGSIAGYAEGETIENCASLCTVSYIGKDTRVGGIVGYVPNSSASTIIRDCYNIGNVTGGMDTGGICGWCTTGQISNCYNAGKVTGNTYTGEIASTYISEPSNCYYLSDTDNDRAAKTVAEFSDGTVLELLKKGERGSSEDPWANECKYLAAAGKTLPVFKGQGDAHTHVQASGWEATETEHWQICSTCGAAIHKAHHDRGSGTCEEEVTCLGCGHKYTVAHDFTAEKAEEQYLKTAAT